MNFNSQTTPITIRGDGNVSSITDHGAGDQTINFSSAMVDANYSASGIPRRDVADHASLHAIMVSSITPPSSSAVRVFQRVEQGGGQAYADAIAMNVQITR